MPIRRTAKPKRSTRRQVSGGGSPLGGLLGWTVLGLCLVNTVLLLFLLAERSGSPGSASRLFEWAAASEEGNVESAAEDRATGSPPVGGRESVDLGEGDSEAASRGDSNQDSSGGSRDAEI